MGDIQNQFSWSFSRYRSFNLCKRQYYFSYYGYWGGWDTGAGEMEKTVYRLKKMMTVPMLVGALVHEMISRILDSLRREREMTLESAREGLIRRFKLRWRESRRGEWKDNPKQKVNLFEHYYGEEMSEEDLLGVKKTMVDSMEGFYESDSYRFIRTLSPRQWLTKEEMDSFDFEGTRVWVKLDFAARHGDKIYVYDWKTGKEVLEDETQLATYGLYATKRWAIALDDLRLFDIYLKKRLPVKMKLNEAIVASAQEVIRHSIEEMQQLLDDRLENRATMENFPMTDDTSLCRRCHFKGVCYPGTWKDL
ncbi:MAG: PD-(D/E)XK nuclease family protein [Fidelibacterota bacterium]